MNEKDDPRTFGNQPYRNTNDSRQLPPWMQADKISPWEKLEINFYKFVTYVPVAITFGVFTFLFIFYTAVSDALIFIFFRFFSTQQLKEISMDIWAFLICGQISKKWLRKC